MLTGAIPGQAGACSRAETSLMTYVAPELVRRDLMIADVGEERIQGRILLPVSIDAYRQWGAGLESSSAQRGGMDA